MMTRLSVSLLALSELLATAPLSVPAIAGTDHLSSEVVHLNTPVFLPNSSGETIPLPSGAYLVSADQPGQLRLTSTTSGSAVVLNAREIAHIETLTEPSARVVAGEGDTRDIVLLSPNGKGLLSEGSSTGVQTRQVVPPASVLRVGDSRRIRVVARTFVNWTGITLTAGQRYRFEVVSNPPKGFWKDSIKETDADGFPTCVVDALCAPFRSLRRIPDANWFVMSGGIGDPSLLALDLHHRFVIGDRRTITAPATGHLGLFANDVSTMYWNNKGAITMTITRIE